MLQPSDSRLSTTTTARAQWLGLLARAPLALLEQALLPHVQMTPHWLRKPETGLMMVEARAGGNGERFNLGEMTVTRCALRLSNAPVHRHVGIAYIVGRSHRHAYLAAVADALLLDDSEHTAIEHALLTPVRELLAANKTTRQARADTSKVDFFTVARESGSDSSDEEQS
ncbi:MAG: phosphonate lyase system protein PhnG [Pseudomonadota bacterium]|jgi:alpha-D-ribose 1-methylphosphonate 5-triphosphate synthase subunit PhnG